MTCIDELNLSETIADEAQLEDVLSTPSQVLCRELRGVDGDLMILNKPTHYEERGGVF
jgi:hypothetical protein